MNRFLLLPNPRKIKKLKGVFFLNKKTLIEIKDLSLGDSIFMGRRLKNAIKSFAGIDYEFVKISSNKTIVGIRIEKTKKPKQTPQSYHLLINPELIEINYSDNAGAFYGISTLIQLFQKYGRKLPCLEIEDSPDFPTRGIMLDVSRSKVPKMNTLFQLVDMLASWKINHLELYMEHSFAYRQHKMVWGKSSPFTGEEIMELDAYCKERYIELVPNQNSFGHFERWLKHPQYAHLADAKGSNTLCPTDKNVIKHLKGLYDELLPHFSSSLFNVGCDETVIGKGRSRKEVEVKGAGRVYFDYLLKIYNIVRERGKTMMFWGDIIIQHPELVKKLPKDIIALEWGYEAKHPYKKHTAIFAESGIPFYVCPGTSSWLSIAGRTDNCIGNLLNAAENGLKNGAIGYLVTDWGDCGHWQYLPVSYLGYAFGAALSWCLETNRVIPLKDTLSLHAFSDRTGNMGKLAYELGNSGTVTGLYIHNDNPLLNLMLFHPLEDPSTVNRIPEGGIERAKKQIDFAMSYLGGSKMMSADAVLIKQEFLNAARLLRHACKRAEVTKKLASGVSRKRLNNRLRSLRNDMEAIMAEHRKLWLARNRSGGLDESLSFMEKVLKQYY